MKRAVEGQKNARWQRMGEWSHVVMETGTDVKRQTRMSVRLAAGNKRRGASVRAEVHLNDMRCVDKIIWTWSFNFFINNFWISFIFSVIFRRDCISLTFFFSLIYRQPKCKSSYLIEVSNPGPESTPCHSLSLATGASTQPAGNKDAFNSRDALKPQTVSFNVY